MDPTEALHHIRSLIHVVQNVDDIELLRKHLKEMLAIANKGITGNVVPLHKKP